MIQTKQELINLLPTIYQNLNTPLFLISPDLKIIASPKKFLKLEINYFQQIFNFTIMEQHEIYIHFHQNATYFFFCTKLDEIPYICVGPIFNRKITTQDSPAEYELFQHVISSYTLDDFFNLPSITVETKNHFIFIYQIITGKILDSKLLKITFKGSKDNPLKQENSLEKEIFQIRETPLHEFSYTYEQKILNYIQNEDSTSARILMIELLQIKDERHLSKNQLQSAKYKVVAAIAVFTRGVISIGVPVDKAYSLSDVYIVKVDQSNTINQLHKLISDAIIDFTQLVKRYRNIQNPYWVKICKNYISHNLHKNITLLDLAKVTEMNTTYLSTQFKKTTGQSIKQYINHKKIQEAQFLIKNSQYSLAQIADILQFSSQSHFNKVFKQIVGKSPIQYKNS